MGKYTPETWNGVRSAVAAGCSFRDAGRAFGVPTTTAWRWCQATTVPRWVVDAMVAVMEQAGAPTRRSPKARLGLEDRCYLASLREQGVPVARIAELLGVHRTTVSRELARSGGGRYDPRAAERQARELARRPKARKLDENGRLRRYVVEGLLKLWSPRQVSLKLRADFPDDGSMRVSHETIYQSIYVQGKGSLRQEIAVEKALRRGGNRRKPRSALPPRPRGNSWVRGCEISRRPAEAEDRAVPGHWEGDLIVGADLRSCLVTLVERKTRFLVARRLETHDTKTVVDLLIEMVGEVPEAIRGALLKTRTWDQGVEMADAARFVRETGFGVFFCDPHAPWQKGSNENTNGLIRQYFPKGTSFTDVTDEEVRAMQDSLNSRPRETLNILTPAEALAAELAKARAMTD